MNTPKVHRGVDLLQSWPRLYNPYKELNFLPSEPARSPLSRLSDLVEALFDRHDWQLHIRIGGVYTLKDRLPVVLPVQSDTILDDTRKNHTFDDVISAESYHKLVQMIKEKFQNEEWKKSWKPTIREYFRRRRIGQVGETCYVETIAEDDEQVISKWTSAGTLTVYRPESLVHFSFQAFSQIPATSTPDELSNVFEDEQTWHVIELTVSQEMGPNFKLELGAVQDQDDHGNHFVHLIADVEQLARHYPNYKAGKVSAYLAILSEMLWSGHQLCKIINEELKIEDSTLEPCYEGLFDLTARTANFYDKKAKMMKKAQDSPIESLRKHNNMVKRVLISQLPLPHGALVLDLACGHGQDILKWASRHMRCYIGIDLSQNEIELGRERVAQSNPKFQIILRQGDLQIDSTFTKLEYDAFDCVSMQLAMHYLMSSEENAISFLRRVTSCLKPGGFFIGSIPSCERIASLMSSPDRCHRIGEDCPPQDYSYAVSNDVYSFTFDWQNFQKVTGVFDVGKPQDPLYVPGEEFCLKQLTSNWGIWYNFWLIDTIDTPEFVVPWREFHKAAAACGLRLRVHCPFDEYLNFMFTQEDESLVRLRESMKGKAFQTMDDYQNEVFSFYKIFIFDKPGPGGVGHRIPPMMNINGEVVGTGGASTTCSALKTDVSTVKTALMQGVSLRKLKL
eukprot:GHVL01008976.1.p1 GENE.GHVL01008976.1~~GHVL01008976.1.p1  ORF type:complete len:677 (+),score=132.83 GHVL01008976.1:19-2049(+)